MSRVQKMNQDMDVLRDKQKALAKCKAKLTRLQKVPLSEMTPEQVSSLSKCRDEQSVLEMEIERVSGRTQTLEYYAATMPILSDYYNRDLDCVACQAPVTMKRDKKDILSIVLAQEDDMAGSVTRDTNGVTRAMLYDNYLSATQGRQTENDEVCDDPDCRGPMMLTEEEDTFVCDYCGLSKPNLAVERMAGDYIDVAKYAYKRANHLSEIINQIQAKESTDIDPQLYIDVTNDLVKRRICISQLDIFDMQKILKRLGHNKHYEHSTYILQKITGVNPPTFTARQEKKLKQMFYEIQDPFEKVKPKTRKNFLSYSYVMRKMLELLELDEFTYYFKKLRHSRKLREHDKVWKGICRILNWQYISSF